MLFLFFFSVCFRSAAARTEAIFLPRLQVLWQLGRSFLYQLGEKIFNQWGKGREIHSGRGLEAGGLTVFETE